MTNRVMMLSLTSILALLVFGTEASGDGCADPQFDASDYAAGVSSRAVALGDLDGDGDLDMAIANSSTTSGVIYAGTEGVHVLLNNGDGTYAPRQFYAAGTAPQSMVLGDIDEDGDLDMVVAELGLFGGAWMNFGVIVLRNDGAGHFAAAELLALDPGFVEPRSAVLGDLDHDGDLDIVVTVGYSSFLHSEIAVMLNAGGGVFGAPQYFPTGYGPHSVALGDLDGDGNLDAVTANYSANSVSHLYGDGAGGFSAPVHASAGQKPRSVSLADLNGNGTLDVAIANHDGLLIRFDVGLPAFYTVGVRPSYVITGDVDQDGDLDLVVANSVSDNVTLLRNDGFGLFPDETVFGTGDAAFGAAIGDVDGSGHQDIVVTNMYSNTATVLLNDCLDLCPADLDGDGTVALNDLIGVLAAWGPCTGCPADLDGDNVVGFIDLLTLLGEWGSCP